MWRAIAAVCYVCFALFLLPLCMVLGAIEAAAWWAHTATRILFEDWREEA